MIVVGRHAELIPALLNVELVRQAPVARLAGASQRAEDVQLIVVLLVVLEVQVHVDAETCVGAASTIALLTAALLASTTACETLLAAAATATASRLRREVVVEAQL